MTPLEKRIKREAELMVMLLSGSISKKTWERAMKGSKETFRDEERERIRKEMGNRANYNFMNNRAAMQGSDEFYALMQLVPEKGMKRKDGPGATVPPGALDDKMLDEMSENTKYAKITAAKKFEVSVVTVPAGL